ncbi:MAG: helix-turn-helix domain-containing protein [Bacillota bacterium]
MASNIETIKDLCKLVLETFHLSTLFINPAGKVSFEFTYHQALNPLYQNRKQNLLNSLNFDHSKKYNFPVIRKTDLLENYIIISVMRNDFFEGTIVIGPSFPYRLSEQKINGLINDFPVSVHKKKAFHHYQTTPIKQNEQLINISIMIFYMINQILLSAQTVKDGNKDLMPLREKNGNTDLAVSKRLQIGQSHHDPLMEKKFFNLIKEGRVEELKGFKDIEEEAAGVLSKSSYIRSRKNIAIIAISLAARASIDGGLHSEIAFTLSDTFIQRIEELNKINIINHLVEEAVFTFTEKVLQIKEQRYSKTITACKNYIYNHLYEKINHDDIAKFVELNPNYLSVLFKKEVGISVSEYIQQGKIDEAKNLISYTDTPLSEICSLLHFTDQSYFTKIFKKFAGVTPKQYREKQHLIKE